MRKKEKAVLVQRVLNALYPQPQIPLDHSDPYTLLIAVVLSAQCTDKRVNTVTPHLPKTPQAMVKWSEAAIQAVIRPCGLSRNKAKAIRQLSQILIDQHKGKVPQTFEELEALPGVGHKTASVVMAQAFGIPAFPVDTHIHRCAKRWGLSRGKSVGQTEKDLKRLFVVSDWIKLHLQIIYFARSYCPAKGHDRSNCPICKEVT